MDAEASVDENADGGVVTSVATENASEVTVDNEHFEVADGNLKLKEGNSLDFESDTSPIDVTITATSEGGDATATVSVSINDVNEAPTISIADGMTPDGMEVTSTVAENVTGAIVGEITLSDPDAGQTHTLMTSDERFVTKQDAEGGWWLALADDASLNYEDGAEVTVTVTVTDSGEPAMSASADVTITVTDVNEGPDAPTVVDADNLSVDENDAGASITSVEATTDPEGDTDITYHVDDSRFEISAGRVLKLKDGMSLNHESEAYVMLTVTARDSDGNVGAGTTVTVHVNDVNEGPDVTGSVATVTANSGERINVSINLTNLFTDPDEGDSAVRWELSGNPSWLSLSVEYTTDANGNEIALGKLRGEPPTTGDDSSAAHKVTLTAKDGDGAAGEVSFYVIVDDGNDDVTGVNLLDHDGNPTAEVEVDENDASGVVLGRITVDDQDHPMHPHGMHRVTVNDSRFEIRTDENGDQWLALKEGVSLDHESRGGEVQVTVTAVDINGERNPNGTFKGTSDSETFAIIVNDVNDAPKAGTIGNWWVTVDDDLDADDVDKGDWLSFALETPADGATAFPAFTDQDIAAGDELTYSISGPSWLEIDEDTGQMTNAEGTVPRRGVYRVTVTATDSEGESASASFHLNVALSEPDDDYTDENEAPTARLSTRNPSYDEGSGDRRVATFTVTDDDQDIPDHPFALKTVEIISITGKDTDATDGVDAADNNVTLVDHDGLPATPMRLWTDGDSDPATGSAGYAAAFYLSDPIKNGDTWTYHIYVRDSDPSASVDTTRVLNHEVVEEITIKVRAVDSVTDEGVTDSLEADTDQEILEIDIGIDDVNERPSIVGATAREPGGTLLGAGTAATPGPRRVSQSEDTKIVLYINLESLWMDDRDDPDELEFGASSSISWIDILHGPGEWSDVIKGPDGETGGGDDLTWGTPGTGATGRTVGTDPTGSTDDVMVVIVEIDRTERNTQGDRGSFTLTAEDENGATGTAVIPVVVTDENEPIGDNAVTLSGSPREGSTLRVNFNDNRDPDLAGSARPALVLYTWYSGDTADSQTDVIAVRTSPDPLRLAQEHVDKYIRVAVTYYETLNGSINSADAGDTDGQPGGEDVTSRPVTNTPDDGVGHFTITASANTLTVAARVVDEDYENETDPAPTLTFSWQVSDNGRGGWEDVDQTGDTDTSTLTLNDGDGKYYRAVASYNEDPDATGDSAAQEEVASHAVRVADVRDSALTDPPTFAAPTISGSPFPGGTLSVEGRGISSVQWQMERGPSGSEYWVNIPGATGSLTLTAAHAGQTVRAVVSYDTTVPGDAGVTTITTTAEQDISGTPSATARPTAVDDYEITATVSGSGHTARGPATGVGEAGVTVSVTHNVPLASLFQDPDTAASRLSFTAAAATTDSGLPTATTDTGRTALFQNAAGVLVLEPNGKLTYVSDQVRTHDGDGDDGEGNILKLAITANDSPTRATGGNSENTAEVSLRINVAPTGIEFAEGPTSATDNRGAASGDLTGLINTHTDDPDDPTLITGVTVNERVTATGNEVLAVIDVQDENSGRHSFGSHEVTVTGDDRFVITNTGATSRDSGSDGSTWELQVVRGSRFDYETDDMDPRTPGTQIVLTLTATDGGGLSTPTANRAAGYEAITLVVTVEDNPVDNPRTPGPSNTPGLKDDAADADDDDTTDGADGDTDGGDATPPPPGTSLGQIEDFVENMDFGDQDLLEDYLLTIDDGIEIA